MKSIKWRPEKRSYLLGILTGFMVGIGAGYILALRAGFDRLGTEVNGEVTLSIAVLRKLGKNDVEAASRLLRNTVAADYHFRVSEKGNWLTGASGLNSMAIDSVNKAADEMPELKQAILTEDRD